MRYFEEKKIPFASQMFIIQKFKKTYVKLCA